jgi:hypothetical protein
MGGAAAVTLWWQPPGYPGDRMLMMSGVLACGAVFPPMHDGRYWRWRAWVTPYIHPVDGVAKSEAEAKGMVEALFRDFLRKAGLGHVTAP